MKRALLLAAVAVAVVALCVECASALEERDSIVQQVKEARDRIEVCSRTLRSRPFLSFFFPLSL